MGKFYIYMQILQGNLLFSGKIYTIVNIFTRLPVVTAATNFKSEYFLYQIKKNIPIEIKIYKSPY